MDPITTSGSIIAVKYDNGILLASDMGICYGTCYKFADVSHFETLSPNIVIGGSGEFSDFQEIVDIVKSMMVEEQCKRAGETLTPSEVNTYIKRVMYNRRSKMKPLVMKVVLAGVNADQTFFLACTDLYGTSWEDTIIGTSYGHHIQGLQLMKAVGGSREQVYKAITEVFTGLYARFSLANGLVEFVDVTAAGIKKLPPVSIEPHWEMIEEVWKQ